MQRFTGMTREVAEFLANRVFCILEDTDGGEAQRVTAEEFGLWIKNLPATLAQTTVPPPAIRAHLNPVSPTPRSRRPSSRPVSARGDDSRPPSQRGMLLPLSTNVEGEFELAEPDLPEEEDDVESCSRTTTSTKRRKRGARKGKGAQAAGAAPELPSGDLAQDLAVASQVLAREISKTSKRSKSPTRAAAPASPSPAKKPSKWKDLLRMSSSDAIAVNTPPPVPFPLPGPPPPRAAHRERGASPDAPSSTAHNVSTLIMGLSPTPAALPKAAPKTVPKTAPKTAPKASPKPAAKSEAWGRGRRKEPRARGSSPWRADSKTTLPVVSRAAQFERWGGDASRSSSTLSGMEKQSERGSSPNSARSRTTAQAGYGASSSNWRNSSSASSISGGTTASSAFTRFSNGSVRSVSTVATSVSAASGWRKDAEGPPAVPSLPGRKKPLPPPPANLKSEWRVAVARRC